MVLSISMVKREWEHFLRNSDVFSVSQRGVTTITITGSWSGVSSYLVNKSDVKNVRSIILDGSNLVYGVDYTYDTNYDDSGVIKLKISFVTSKTGSYVVTYDYGHDKIYSDFPRSDLTISSFPRIGFDIISIPSVPGGFGGVNLNKVNISTIVYSPKVKDLEGYIDDLRSVIFNNKLGFVRVGKYLRIIGVGPVLKSPREQGKDKVFQQNIDVVGEFLLEV